jgi:hypothetical protein
MKTCANCNNAAQYVYAISESHEILYCFDHLPRFLTSQKNAGMLKTVEEFEAVKAEALSALETSATKKSKKVKEATVEEAPVVEEPVAEEEPTTPTE